MKDEIRVLIAEDFAPDAELNKIEISKALDNASYLVVDNQKDFEKALDKFDPHLVVSDYLMPQFDGLTALKITQAKSDIIPFILCTGSTNEDIAVECMKQGATDYIIKEHNKRLGVAVINALELRENLMQKKQNELLETLRKNNQHILVEASSNLLFASTRKEIYQIVTDAVGKLSIKGFVVISEADLVSNMGHLVSVAGIEKYLNWIKKTIGFDPLNFNTTLSLEATRDMKYNKGNLVRIENGLYEFIEKKLPLPTCKLIEKALKINEIQHIGFTCHQTYAGGLTLLLQNLLHPLVAETIEILVKQASQAIEKLQALEDAQQNQARLQSLLNIAQFNTDSVNEFLEKALEEILTASQSTAGFIARYHEEVQRADVICWSKEILIKCRSSNLKLQYRLKDTGIWGEAIQQKKAIVLNDFPSTSSFNKDFPLNKLVVKKLLVVPIIFQNQISGVVSVINKDDNYTSSDITQLALMIDVVWKWVRQKMIDLVLFQNREKLRNIMDDSPIGIASFNDKGYLTASNVAFKNVFGLPLSIHTNHFNLFNHLLLKNEELEKLESEMIIKIEKTLHFSSLEDAFKTKIKYKGRMEVQMTIKKIIINPSNKQSEYILQIEDITERKKIDHAKNEFINTVSHEMRTPLTSIQQALVLISNYFQSNMTEEQINLLNIAQRNTDRLSKLVTNVLDFQKLSSFLMEINIKPHSINDIILQIMSDLSSFTFNEKVIIETSLERKLPLVLIDKDKISQVLINLISNAVKFTPQGTITIGTSYDEEKKQVKVFVKDTGIGIGQEHIKDISLPFFQIREDSRQKISGTGLGLSICKKILENHGSTLLVTSERHKGSIFCFYLDAEET